MATTALGIGSSASRSLRLLPPAVWTLQALLPNDTLPPTWLTLTTMKLALGYLHSHLSQR